VSRHFGHNKIQLKQKIKQYYEHRTLYSRTARSYGTRFTVASVIAGFHKEIQVFFFNYGPENMSVIASQPRLVPA
jgi:hypothetical protein